MASACGQADAAERLAIDPSLLYPTRHDAVREGIARLRAADATLVASAFWLTSMVTFVAAALGMAGVGGLAEAWRAVAAVAALVSLAGIVLFVGTWPPFNTGAAIAVNAGVLALLVAGR